MIANVGSLDRVLRFVLGVALIAAALLSGWAVFDGVALKYGAVAVGLVMLATAAFRFCPLYTVLGVKTCRN
ncbi:MAG: DUF2892 domain-containing protein [Xanthobacteraceae bacterium]